MSNRLNPAWDRFPTPLSVVCPVSLLIHATYCGNFLVRLSLLETGSLAYTPTCLVQSLDLEIKANTDYLGSPIFGMHQASLSDMTQNTHIILFLEISAYISLHFGIFRNSQNIISKATNPTNTKQIKKYRLFQLRKSWYSEKVSSVAEAYGLIHLHPWV